MVQLSAGNGGAVRMDQLSAADLDDGRITSETGSMISIDAGDGYVDTFTGTGFTYNSQGQPTGGTVTGYSLTINGGSNFTVTGANVDVPTLYSAITQHDTLKVLNLFLSGDDTATGSGQSDYLITLGGNNFMSGGLGADTLVASSGNNHVWGAAAGAPVQGDGADLIVLGGGSNYVNGNAGNDRIEVGVANSTGANRLYGGADQDTIVIHGAGANSANGNVGDDTIDASDATGNNSLRGGQGSDVIRAGLGRDQLLGDIGDDRLVAGTGGSHLTIMTGGDGADTFDFSRGSQGSVTVSGSVYYSGVTDFQHGSDHVGLAFAVGSGDVLTSATSYADVASAQAAAQALLSAHAGTTDVAAMQVGGDTFLFYDAAGTADGIDSIVHLTGIAPSTLGSADFSKITA